MEKMNKGHDEDNMACWCKPTNEVINGVILTIHNEDIK